MKKINKILIGIIGFILLGGLVYASVTTASIRKSSFLPWQGTLLGYYDSSHNVGTSNIPQTRFSFTYGSTAGGTSIVRDSVTKLYWQSGGVIGGSSVRDGAKSYCDNLVLGTYSDWRLPNIKELSSIVDFDKYNPSINTTFFQVTTPYSYWTSTNEGMYAEFVDFFNGSSGNTRKAFGYSIRCVR